MLNPARTVDDIQELLSREKYFPSLGFGLECIIKELCLNVLRAVRF